MAARPGSPFSQQEGQALADAAEKAGRHDDAKRLRAEFGQAPEPAPPRRLRSVPDPKPAKAKPAFSARRVLSRTGFRLRDEFTPGLASIGKVVTGQTRTSGISTFALAVLGGLLSLVLLDLLVSNRGSSITSSALSWMSGALTRLTSPTDPLTAPGHTSPLAAATQAQTTTQGVVTSPVAPLLPVAAGKPTGRSAPVPGTTVAVDAAYLSLTEWIAKTFGVTVTSGWRSVVDNSKAGGAPGSDHLTGRAVDFGGSAPALARLYSWANAAGFPYVESPAQAVALGEGPHVHISFWRP